MVTFPETKVPLLKTKGLVYTARIRIYLWYA